MRQGTVIAIAQSVGSEQIIGYRIKGTAQFGGKVADVNADTMRNVLQQVPDAIDNLVLNGSAIEFTNGSYKRYTDLNNLRYSPTSLVVIAKYVVESDSRKVAYELSDYMGETRIINEEEIGVYASRLGTIANGKLVDRNGKQILSAIQGEYPVIKVKTDEAAGIDSKARVGEEYLQELEADRIATENIRASNERIEAAQRERAEKFEAEQKEKADQERQAELRRSIEHEVASVVGVAPNGTKISLGKSANVTPFMKGAIGRLNSEKIAHINMGINIGDVDVPLLVFWTNINGTPTRVLMGLCEYTAENTKGETGTVAYGLTAIDTEPCSTKKIQLKKDMRKVTEQDIQQFGDAIAAAMIHVDKATKAVRAADSSEGMLEKVANTKNLVKTLMDISKPKK